MVSKHNPKSGSTFRAEKFNIKYPPHRTTLGIVEEAIYLLKRHFIHRHKFSEEMWKSIRQELLEYSDPRTAVEHFMAKFEDPYTRFIPEHIMSERANVIRGERGTCGIVLSRVWSFQLLKEVMRRAMQMQGLRFGLVGSVSPSPSTPTSPPPQKISLPSSHTQNSLAQLPLSGPTFWGYLTTGLDTICPLLIATWMQFRPPLGTSVQVKRLVGTACLLSVLVSSCFKTLPLVRPYQVSAISSENAKKSGLAIGDLVLFVNHHRAWRCSSKAVRKLLNDGGDIGDDVELDVLRRVPLSSQQARDSEKRKRWPVFGGNTRSQGNAVTENPEQSPTGKMISQYLKVNVTREAELLPKVTSKVLPESQGPGLGYLAIEEFTDNTLLEVTSALDELRRTVQFEQKLNDLNALIIDLRGNPGGPLGSALDVAALFLPHGTVLTQIIVRGNKEKHTCINHNPNKKTPLLLLTDSATASASEILVASLCEHERAESMGRTTVGKNLAQAIMVLSDGSGLAFTVAEYLTPKGLSMAAGLEPARLVFERDLIELPGRITWGPAAGFQLPLWCLQRDSTTKASSDLEKPQRFPMTFGLSHLQH